MKKTRWPGAGGFRRISGRNQLVGRIVEVPLQRIAAAGETFDLAVNAFRPSSRRTRHAKCAWKRARPRQPSSNPPKS